MISTKPAATNGVARLSTAERWIETGYELFAREGEGGLQVERLARILSLNKSGFYHYFINPQTFTRELFNYHKKLATQMAIETISCKTLDPDYFRLIVKYKSLVFFQRELLQKNDVASRENSLEIKAILDESFLPLWSELVDMQDDPELALKCLDLFRNSFYMKANLDNLDYDFLHQILIDTKELIKDVIDIRTMTKNLEKHAKVIMKI